MGDLVGNRLVADDGFGADDALGEGGGGDEKCASDLFRGEAADLSQGEGELGFGRQSGMAAGEDEAEAVVVNFRGLDFAGGRSLAARVIHLRVEKK